MGLRVQSTTDTQEDVNVAAGLTPDGKETDSAVPMEQKTPAPAATEKPAETQPAKPAAAEDGKKGKKESGWQKRIDKLTGRNYALEADLRTAREEQQRLSDRLAVLEGKKPAAAEPKPDERPLRASFATDEEYEDALIDFRMRQNATRTAAQRDNAETQAATKQMYDDYNARVAEAKSKYEDWDEVTESVKDAPIPEAVTVAVVKMPNGPDVAYWLSKNPDFREALMDLDPMDCALTMALVGEDLRRGEDPLKRFTVEGEGAPAAAAPAAGEKPVKGGDGKTAANGGAKPPSKAPAPVSPVGTGRSSEAASLDGLNFQEYAERRRAGRTH